MAITELRILPPFAIARLGSSPTPLEAYQLVVNAKDPLDYRKLEGRPTFVVDPESGAIVGSYTPKTVRFRDDGNKVRPVAPFLEVYAKTSDMVLEPLTLDLLAAEGAEPGRLRWSVTVGNIKAFRRTGDPDDKIIAKTGPFTDHVLHPLLGECKNFLPDKVLPFGQVRYIQPTRDFPQIRLRFTPAAGKVYGSRRCRFDPKAGKEVQDPIFLGAEDRIIYNPKGKWLGHIDDPNGHTNTNPGSIFAGYPNAEQNQVSWGYLDDECDGTVTCEWLDTDGTPVLAARAYISAGAPTYAPDSLPIRSIADEIEQLLLGPEVEGVPLEQAVEIVRRALDSVRLMNTAVMNANTINGRANIASTMARQDTADYGRQFGPIMASSLVDNFAVRALHERVLTALLLGSAPWFSDVLRRPDEIGDFTDKGRRKMPAMMRGADGRMLALTRRQINTILKAATGATSQNPSNK